MDFYKETKGIFRCWCELNIRRNQQIGNSGELWLAECNVLRVENITQRRKDLRVQTNMAIFYTVEGNLFARGAVKNISAGGIYLNTSEVMKNGTRFHYEYTLDDRLCENSARVVYGRLDPGSHKYGYGCIFTELSLETARTIRMWCHKHQKRKISA